MNFSEPTAWLSLSISTVNDDILKGWASSVIARVFSVLSDTTLLVEITTYIFFFVMKVNSKLPDLICEADGFSDFRTSLKTFLFKKA